MEEKFVEKLGNKSQVSTTFRNIPNATQMLLIPTLLNGSDSFNPSW